MFDELIKKEILEETDRFFAKSYLSTIEHGEKEELFMALLFRSARQGHLCLTDEMLNEFPQLKASAIQGSQKLNSSLVVHEKNGWYLPRNFQCEKRVIENIQRLLIGMNKVQIDCQKGESFGLTEEQEMALKHIAQSPFSIICGGPGTGKTYLARVLIACSQAKEIVVGAPTGKAAANLREKLEHFKVLTLHKLLKAKKPFPQSPYLTADLIIIDEGSMIDARLFAHLLSAIKTHAKLVVFGDPHQLPPVSSGNLFSDLANQHGFFLHRCHRTDLKVILDFADFVRKGESQCAISLLHENHEALSLHLLPDPKNLVKMAASLFDQEGPLNEDKMFLKLQNKRILTPMRKGSYGTLSLSSSLNAFLRYPKLIPIIITANEERLDLYNGDIGLLHEEMAFFPHKDPLPVMLLPPYELAYFLSVHKSQGSEYDEVHLILPEVSTVFGREMLYTAITRAKNRVFLYGNEEILKMLIDKKEKRVSGL